MPESEPYSEINNESIKSWFKALKTEINKQYRELDESDKNWIDSYAANPLLLDDLDRYILIWINDKIKYQLLIFDEKFDNETSDLTILGPYKTGSFIENVLQDFKELGLNKKDIPVKKFIDFITYYEFYKNDEKVFIHDVVNVFIKGNVLDYEISDLVKNIFESELKIKPNYEGRAIITFLKTINDNPFKIGEIIDLEDDIIEEKRKETEYVINNARLAIFSNGQISIKSDNKSNSNKIVNAFIAVLNIQNDITFSPLKDTDFYESSINLETMDYEGLNEFYIRKSQPFTVSLDNIRNSLFMTRNLLGYPNLINFYQLLLKSKNHFIKKDFSQSFHLSWIILEMHVSNLWDEVLIENNEQINSYRKKKLLDTVNWSVDPQLEVLSLLNRLPIDDYKKIMKWKKIRNNFVHDGIDITLENCVDIYEYVRLIIVNKSIKLGIM